jgi:hypothetical protein
MRKTSMTQTTYNNANAEDRKNQLLNAKVDESMIQDLSRTPTANFSQAVREKLIAPAQCPNGSFL